MYGRIEDLLRLALLMQGMRGGVSLEDIMEGFGVSRSTAERMRNAVLRAFPQAEEVPGAERVKRWRIPTAVLSGAIAFEAAELEELRLAADRLRAEGLGDRARALAALGAKLQALMTAAARRRVEPDLEALLEAEGHAMRPGPRPAIAEGLLAMLRLAMVGCRAVRARYRRRIGGRVAPVEVEPHAILFGQRHYLIAFPAGGGGAARVPKLYALANLSDVSLTERVFTRRPDFDLPSYAARSFGVFQEEPVQAVWRFSPALAADALEHHFHPSERKQQLEDGRVEVRFTAGGLVEMCWHLFTWGPGVEVVAPDALREHYLTLLDAAREATAPRARLQVA